MAMVCTCKTHSNGTGNWANLHREQEDVPDHGSIFPSAFLSLVLLLQIKQLQR